MWYQKTAEETEHYLGTDLHQGLTAREHERRLARNGENVLTKKKKKSALLIFLSQYTDFMIMVLMAAAVISAALGETVDAVMILAIIMLNGVLGFIQEYQAERSLEALKVMTEDEARVIVGGELLVKKAAELVVGDVVILDTGTKVPADIRLTESFRLKAEESILTGEAKDVSKTAAVIKDEAALSQRKNMCYSGTVITGGRGRGIVVETGMATELGSIAEMLNKAKPESTPLQKQLKHLGKNLIALCVVVCGLVAVAGFLLGGDGYTMILTGVSLGVASIPEGLPIVVTVCLALGVRRLTKANAIVRRLPAVETLGCTTCICTDKTGTLTENRMETKHYYSSGAWHSVADFVKEKEAAFYTNLIVANCNSLYRENGEYIGDSTERALVYGALKNGAPVAKAKVKDELSFDSERKRMSVLAEYEGETYSLVKGAPSVIFPRCRYLLRGDGKIPLGYEEKRAVAQAAAEYAGKGFRVIALALRKNAVSQDTMETDLTFISLAALSDTLRPEAAEALMIAKKAGIRSIMITGDQRGTALAVGRELGIAETEEDTLSGEELRTLSDRDLSRRLSEIAVIATATPGDKMRVVSILKAQNEICAMTGDGVNDAPALKAANIGIAMGKKGTDVTKEAADFVLADDRFSSIVEAIYQGRGIYDNIRKFIRYLLSSNLGEILVMLCGVLLCFPLPLLPLQILWINLVTDGLPAMALGMEPPARNLMAQPPRPVGGNIFSNGLGLRIFSRGLAIGILCFAVFFYAIADTGNIDIARTMTFNALVLSQLFYVFDCRSEKGFLLGRNFFANAFLLWVMLISFVLQGVVIYHPLLNHLFHTVPLSPENLLLTVVFAGIPTGFSVIKSLFMQKKKENC